ncbi:MAG: pilus assembly protein [Acidimicrobiia bacterium]|nr:pilus assembly protein [Acidimicrobiia bacterium]NNF70077.1 pilus assembly protein [Acidimicrobiia bacterium]NNK91241.1 pilus assembly protein [Acidimicrobiia bacterium]
MSDRGSAAVEFALVVPLVLVALLAIVETAVVGRTQLAVVSAAREGAREAAAHPDVDRAVDAVHQALGPELAEAASVTVRRPGVVGEPAQVVVTVRHRVSAGFFGGFHIDLRGRAAMRVER